MFMRWHLAPGILLLAACGGSAAPPAASAPVPQAAAGSEVASSPATPTEAPPNVPPGTQWARGERFSLVLPVQARELAQGRWEIAGENGETTFNLGISTGPFSGSADDYLRGELGNTSLAPLVFGRLGDLPDAPGWRAWSVVSPSEQTQAFMRARYLTDRNRTVFGLCVREERNAAQDAICSRILATLRFGAAAERSTTDATLTTISENDAAIDVPATWRRQAGDDIQIMPSAQSPDAERDMVVFLGVSPDTTNMNQVIDASIAGVRGQANTTVDVRERRVRRVGAGSEGVLTLRSTTQSVGQRISGRAYARGGWAWTVICVSPESAPAAQCEQSLASFRAIPR